MVVLTLVDLAKEWRLPGSECRMLGMLQVSANEVSVGGGAYSREGAAIGAGMVANSGSPEGNSAVGVLARVAGARHE